MKTRNLKKSFAYSPVEYEVFDVASLQALARGNATEHQQKHALKFIIERLSDTYGLSFRPDQRETDFAEGKRFVGLQMIKLLKLNLNKIKGVENGRSEH